MRTICATSCHLSKTGDDLDRPPDNLGARSRLCPAAGDKARERPRRGREPDAAVPRIAPVGGVMEGGGGGRGGGLAGRGNRPASHGARVRRRAGRTGGKAGAVSRGRVPAGASGCAGRLGGRRAAREGRSPAWRFPPAPISSSGVAASFDCSCLDVGLLRAIRLSDSLTGQGDSSGECGRDRAGILAIWGRRGRNGWPGPGRPASFPQSRIAEISRP